ncbi:MAG: O-antigen ligase family protein [Candidatus Omnitrophica bacterium]|nr:O-antigen ligase family protein [Candidatus Omnitrophota bacterium]MDD5670856.1 O-antigen ligase family protein [Candidatus Omnitrophota bacterium]
MNFLVRMAPALRVISFWALCFFWVALTFSKAFIEISFTTALIAWIGWKIGSRSMNSLAIPKSLAIPFLVYTLIIIASAFWSDFPKESFRGVFKVLENMMLFVLVAEIFQSREDMRKYEKIFLGWFAFVVLNGFWQYFAGKDLLRGFPVLISHSGKRVTASFGSYGQFASFLICSIPFLAAAGFSLKALRERKPLAVLACLTFAGAIVLLFLTRSRGAIIAFVFGVILFLVIRRKIWFLILLAAVLAGGYFLLPRNMILHQDRTFKEQSLLERHYLWDRALSVIQARPWTGTGINTYIVAYSKYDRNGNWRVRNYYVHNGYLQMAAETGLPSLLLFLWFLGQYFWLSFKQSNRLQLQDERPRVTGLLVGIMSFLIFAFSDTVLHNVQPAMTLWFLLGLQWAYQRAFNPIANRP